MCAFVFCGALANKIVSSFHLQGHVEPIMFLDWSLDGCFLQSLSTDYEHIVCKFLDLQNYEVNFVFQST